MVQPSIDPVATTHVSRATVATEAAARYAKQLASHFGHKAEVRTEAAGSRIVLTVGTCLLVAGQHVLELRAQSESLEGLERIQQVIGSHLERFGQRDGLTVEWVGRD